MATEVIFPKVDMDMQAGSIIEWLKKEGDEVSEGEPLFVIETDKASMEIEASGSGYLALVAAELNTPVLVGTTVAWILESRHESLPLDQRAAPAGADEANRTITPAHRTATSAADQPYAEAEGATSVRASPAARRTARELSVDLSKVQGKALRGRIVASDVHTAANSAAPGNAQITPAGASGTASTQSLPHSTMRKRIAARLQASVQEVPAFQLSVDIDCKNLINTRDQLTGVKQRRPAGQDDSIPTINDFAVKALALALQDIPVANCSWQENAMLQYTSSDIAIAVSVAEGVLAPVIRQAESRSLQSIAGEARELALRAREHKLAPREYQGGSTTVSNLGMYGVRSFSSIIVPPQASVVSIGCIRETALVREGRVRAGKVLTATFTFDHRVIDGVPGAQLADAFRHYLQHPVELLRQGC